MRNLKISLNIKLELTELSNADVIVCNKSLTGEERVFILKNDLLYCLNVQTDELSSFSLTELHPFGGFTPVVDILFSDLYESTFHAFHNDGQISSWTFDDSSSTLQFSSADLSLPGTPLAIKRSPDQEYLAVVTEDHRVLLVDSLMSLVEEHPLNGDSAGEQVMINVGWGKKETQFHGSEGKAAAVAKSTVVVDHSSLGIGRRPVISWRGDGDLFAVGYWSIGDDRRRVRVFNRAGILQCSDEGVPGLDEPLSWKPQGSVIAVAQTLPDKNCISFFEKNGLKHGEFPLPESWKATSMEWNSDSKILCIVCEDKNSEKQWVTFWTTGNYHWYLKQTLQFDSKVRRYVWDETKSGRITVITDTGCVHVVQFSWTTDHSQFSRFSDDMFVSVIDNASVLVTPFKQVIIPPPMSLFNFKCGVSVNQVLYPPTDDSSELVLCTVLSNGSWAFFSLKDDEPVLTKTVDAANQSSMCHCQWIRTNRFLCYSPLNRKTTRIDHLSIDGEDGVSIVLSRTVDYPIISSLITESQIIWLTDTGDVVHFNPDSGEMTPPEKVFPELCTDIIAHGGKLFGLSEFGRLYMNGTQIASSISSFLVHSPYILTTTFQHNMLILEPVDDRCEEVCTRKLENGSRLVAATGHSVVMQLPRGNLETIQPRVLIISSSGSLLDKCLYDEAVALMKRQRIDLNLVVDHNPPLFLANVSKFVNQVDPKWITLFVTELKPDDSTVGIYSNFYKNNKPEGLGAGKINSVCEALLRDMAASGEKDKYTMATLSCLVRMRKMREAIELASDDRSIKDLCFLVDVSTLYSEALGVYNLSAALKFASKSQMDPKEYIPYLNSLKAMDPDYMKYTIDKSLKKYKSALTHLAKCGDDKMKEFLDLLTEHNLYATGLTLFETNSDTYKLCANLFGDYLKTLKRLDEATVMYERAGELPKVLDIAKRAGNWKKALVMARRLNYSTEKIEELGEELNKILTVNQSYNEAGRLAKELGLAERAVTAFLQGRCWEEAIYSASNSDNRNLESSIKDNLSEAYRNLLSEIRGKQQDLTQYILRLKVVRTEKAAKPKFFDIADNMSETSSVSSTRTSESVNTKSSRMTRKMSRKMWSLKEGNPREEEALVKAVTDIIVSLEKSGEEVKSLNLALIEMNLNGEAYELQNSLKVLLAGIPAMKREVWPNIYSDDEINVEDEKLKFPPSVDLSNKWELEYLRIS